MDTSCVILAVGSPPGRSLRGLVRISGNRAFELLGPHLEHHAPSSDVLRQRGAHFARLTLASFQLPTIVLSFPAPRSYMGEDSIELQLPGNPVLLERVIDALLASARERRLDARRAEPGEFTARAFFNGRLDLTQAEGVAATIAAVSDAQLRAAQLLTSGSLGSFAHQVADELASALALVEAGIDFTDQEDVVAISPADLYARLRDLHDRVDNHLKHAVGMEQLEAIPWVVLAGEPNAGKSALFNALLGRERAVVSPISGTTRDVLAEPLTVELPGGHGTAEVMLVDLAGLDPDDASSINRLMQSAARQAIERAELILRCVPVNQPAPETIARDELLVRTKADQLRESEPKQGVSSMPGQNEAPAPVPIITSAHTAAGLDELRREIARRLADRAVSLAADAVALRPRHEAALRAAKANLREAIDLVEPLQHERSLGYPELIASSMRGALDHLANLAGDITPDDVLGRVFATFCVGK